MITRPVPAVLRVWTVTHRLTSETWDLPSFHYEAHTWSSDFGNGRVCVRCSRTWWTDLQHPMPTDKCVPLFAWDRS